MTVQLLALLHSYGAFALFGLLALGIIGLPVPEETLILMAGYWVRSQKEQGLGLELGIILGTLVGITGSYLMGRYLGYYAVQELCKRLRISADKLIKARQHFNRIGQWCLAFGYFVPGLRHFTGLLAGTTRLSYLRFALFAYIPGLFWSQLFFFLGFFYGEKALIILAKLYHHALLMLLLMVSLGLAYYLYQKYYHKGRSA